MRNSVSATEARIHFGAIMQDALRSQQPIVVEKSGKPQVVILAYARYHQIVNGETKDWRAMLAEGHALVNTYLAGRELPSPVEMLEEGRQVRDEELAHLR
jgi:prevent-host-death family protein